jgi:hypothetical protein
MVLSNRLGGVKDALLLIAKSYAAKVAKSFGSQRKTCGSGLAREGDFTFNICVG